MEDWQLLDNYARTRSEAAFAQVVDRHLGLVHGAARRQVNDDALAADVAQAVFLLLARKAGSFGPRTVLAGWLFRTTRFVATRALRAEIRRQRREQEAAAMQHLHVADPHWNRLAPELDEALARLGESDRSALLLRFADGRNHREVGMALGLSEEAAKKRVNRALDKLRGALTRHGVTLSAAVLTGLLTDRLCAAPPDGLAASITHAAVTGIDSTSAGAGLAQQALAIWRRTRLAWVAAWVGGAALVAAWMFIPRGAAPRGASSDPNLAGATSRTPPAAHVAGIPPRLTGSETFRIRVIAADTGQPLPGARVLLNFVSNGEWITPEDRETDAAGECPVALPRGALMRMDVGAHFPGYENRFFTWRSDWQHPRPDSHTLKLGRAETVGGQVVDEQGRAIPAVSVWLTYQLSDASWREPQEDIERLGFMRRIRLGATDAQGRWLCSTIPPARERFAFEFEHPDHVKNTALSVSRDDESAVGRETLALLKSRKAMTTLKTGAVAFGQIVNGAGEPIPGARIGTSWNESGAIADAEGQFTMRSLPRGEVLLVASAEGYAPRKFRAQAGGGATRVQLDPGGLLRARIVDTNSEPIAGATLVLEDGFGDGALGWDGRTDEDGRVEWRSAPPGRTFNFTAYAPGYRYLRRFPLAADGTEQTVILHPRLDVVGTVVDAQSGQPIARFKAIPGEGNENPNFDRSELHYGTDGHYRLSFAELGAPVVRLEAEGYETEIAAPRPGPAGEPRCDFRLRRVDPNGGIRGGVFHPDGTPAAGVEVILCTLEKGAVLGQGRFLDHSDSIFTHADDRGRFQFPVVHAPHTVVAVSPRGFGRASVQSSNQVEIRLEPFGAIEGRLLRDGQPLPGRSVLLLDQSSANYRGAVSLDIAAFSATTDATGAFRIGGVPAGDFLLYQNPGMGQPFTGQTVASVLAGQVTTVVMGQLDPTGRTVVGQLKPSEPILGDWQRMVSMSSFTRKLPLPEPPTDLTEEARQLWRVAWHQSEAGGDWLRQWTRHDVEVAADGRFTIRGVAPGEYEFWLEALPEETPRTDPWRQQTAPWWGHASPGTVIVPPAEPGSPDAPFDLGDVTLKIQRRKR